jgi:NAD(P)-dependent dehydrogenase (short-subunit alcohol dehydrogenase family)
VPLALITGASTGIGRASALHLVGRGWTVLAGVRNPRDGESLVAEGGERLTAVTLDITDAGQVDELAGRVQDESSRLADSTHGGLDALVNNAGIAVGGPLELLSGEELRTQFEVNVFGQLAVTRALLPALRRAHGRIVFVSSIGGRVATPYAAPYSASKHAIEAFADALRVELCGSRIEVALLEPGSVATPIWEKGRADTRRVSVPPELAAQYGHVAAAMDKTLRDTARRGVSPEQVARTIEGALTAPRMRARYLVGREARAMLIARRLLPDLLFDRLIKRALGV